MAGKFEHKPFSEIDLSDPFFDSLKADYPGTSSSTGFTAWFSNKAREGRQALVFSGDQGIGAFISLKHNETESIPLSNGDSLPPAPRIKISTIKIGDRYRNQRIGEGALGLILWDWRSSGIDEIYVTVFDKHAQLIGLLEAFGFVCVGNNRNGERVYIKDRRHIDFSDPLKAFPFLSGHFTNAGLLVIDMDYHDTIFAYSELANTLQNRVDMSVANGLKKVYIGQLQNTGFNVGDPVLIYRKHTGIGKAGYKSAVTSFCIATRIETIKRNGQFNYTADDYIDMIGNKSVYSNEELLDKYNSFRSLTLIELLYCGYFGAGNNVNWSWLKNNGCWEDDTYPSSFRYTREQFVKILTRGAVDVHNLIID